MVNRRNTRRNRKTSGGGWGFTGASSVPGQVNNPMVYSGIGDCRATQPSGFVTLGRAVGLPGMSGGGVGVSACSSRKNRRRNRKQNGGRYGFNLADAGSVAPNGAAWWAATYPPVQRIACEGSTPNPMNPGPHTPSTQPPLQKGGAAQPSLGGDNLAYYAPTAGYSNDPSTWKDSVGAPVQIQTPFAARSMNPACLTTGGPSPLTGALVKQAGGKRKSRKNRKNRKTNRR
jgi:hypothetical protein